MSGTYACWQLERHVDLVVHHNHLMGADYSAQYVGHAHIDRLIVEPALCQEGHGRARARVG